MKKTIPLLVAFALSACAPPVPDSGQQGVGFENYQDYGTYRARRDGELTGASTPPSPSTNVLPPDPSASSATAPVAGSPSGGNAPVQTAAVELNNPGISDEQDFSAVSGRQSIESDAERLRAQREAYQVIEPTAVPRRSGSGPNIVEYAITTSNPLGQKAYRRNVVFAQSRYERNCAKFASSDLAQEAFLRAGGPERDKMGLDPDGDGYACTWDPTPFRRISTSNG